jgi:SHS2 domain-containing protein
MIPESGSRARAFHVFEEHTGEVEVRIESSSLAELYAEAARALAELMLSGDRTEPTGAREDVIVRAPDRVALLVDWLNEIIFRCDTRRKVYPDVDVTACSERELRASIRGLHPESIRTAVKAATFHRADVAVSDTGFRARVVLDV